MSFVSFAVRLLPAAFVLLPGVALAQDARRPEEPFTELPIVDWQEEMRLSSEVRQVIFNAYLPMLARPTFYKGTHDDEVPNQVKDWAYQRQSVRDELLARAGTVDMQRRSHAALPDAEVNHLIGKKVAFRPEQLEPMLTTSPRFEDLVVTIRRLQPLGGETYRVDFDVKTKSNGVVENTSFDAVDIVHQGANWLLPTEILLNVAPMARAQQAAASGGEGGLNPLALAGSFISIATKTIDDVLPFDLPKLPFLP